MVKTVSYTHTNSYETLNELTEKTENIWICFHGLGYLATYFKRYFEGLDPEKNYVIVPQAPSKFYIGKKFKHVGACWLTKVDTGREMQNNLQYIRSILDAEQITGDRRIVLFGYSQGVSISTRFLKNYYVPIKAMILHSGSIPAELDHQDSKHFKIICNQFIHISGMRDEYATPEREAEEMKKVKMLFGTECEIHRPDIKHIVHVPLIEDIAKRL
ncbi:MAG: esterase [Nonlabens sp.]